MDWTKIIAAASLASLSTAFALDNAHAGPRKNSRDIFQSIDAGEPGKPTSKSLTVAVRLSGLGGRLVFRPQEFRFSQGQSVKFDLHNETDETHEFILGSYLENIAHAETMKLVKNIHHHYTSGRVLAAKSTASFVWKFTKVGTFEFTCLLPHHDHSRGESLGKIVVE